MSNRRFEMYEYRQIIVRLRQGDTRRGIAQSGLANRKKVRVIRKIACIPLKITHSNHVLEAI